MKTLHFVLKKVFALNALAMPTALVFSICATATMNAFFKQVILTNMKKLIIKILYSVSLFFAQPALAVESSKTRFKNIASGGGFANLPGGPQSLIINIITYVLGLAGVFFLVLIIYSGWQWIAAGGNEEMIAKAKNRLKNAIIGLGVIIAAYAITAWVLTAVLTAGNIS